MKGTITVCGHLCLDIIPGFPQSAGGHDYFRPGRLSTVGAPVIATGGAVSNVGISLHRLGFPSRLVAKVGDDPLGRLLAERVSAMGPELGKGLVSVRDEVTSYTVVLSPPGVDRIFLHCPGANDTFTQRDLGSGALEGAAIFHFGYPPLMKGIYGDGGRGLTEIFHRAREKGALTSLDMSLPDPSSESGRVDWTAFLSRVLPEVDMFVPSIEELLYMLDRPLFSTLAGTAGGEAIIRGVTFAQLGALAQKVHSLGAPILLIKLGDRGVYLGTAKSTPLPGWESRELYSPVFKVESVAGTTGAGDATIAGFLASIYQGLTPEEALTMAVAVGGCCVEAPDATSGIRAWEETAARVKAGWPKAAASVTDAGWSPQAGGIWKAARRA